MTQGIVTKEDRRNMSIASGSGNFAPQTDPRFFVAGKPVRVRRRAKKTPDNKEYIRHHMAQRMTDLVSSFRGTYNQEDFKTTFGAAAEGSVLSTPGPFPIDAVFTWVQSTPGHIASRRQHASKLPGGMPSDNGKNRYKDNEELRYALRSIYQNARWFRKIFIVVDDQQCPLWLKVDSAQAKIPVVVVPHSFLYGDAFGAHLPTFNSQSIETHLHCIPGLSEHFVYFNDDMFVSEPVSWTHFFTAQKQPKYIFNGFVRTGPKTVDMCKHSMAWINNSKVLDKRFPHTRGLPRKYPAHQAIAMLRSSFEEIWSEPQIGPYLTLTSASKFRDKNNMYLIGFLALYNMYSAKAIEHQSTTMFTQVTDNTNIFMLAQTILEQRPSLLCINDGISRTASEKMSLVQSLLHNLFPIPSEVELEGHAGQTSGPAL